MRKLAWILAVLLAACSDASGPRPQQPEPEPPEPGPPQAQLNFVRQGPDAPPLDTRTVSFYAYVGRATEVEISYEGGGAVCGDEFLEFEVPARSLYLKPDRSPFVAGDSVLITITVVDQLFQFEFQPAGLVFHPKWPAELEIEYCNADPDFDDDGDVDDDDAAIETQLGLWRQGAPGEPWVKVPAGFKIELDEIEADIFGFSRFAVAW